MDSINETIKKAQQEMKIFPLSSDEETFPCEHGTMVRKDQHGRLNLWECAQCEREKEAKKKAARDSENKAFAFNRVMFSCEYAKIPKRFESKNFDNFKAVSPHQKRILDFSVKFVERFKDCKENGTSVVFCGKPGTGKTHLAYAMISALRKQLQVALMITASDMTGLVKSAYKSEEKTPESVVKEFSEHDLLVIDEVGIQVDSEAEKRIFFDVINKRYDNMLPTMMISNLELNELTKFVGERVMDRMRENGGTVFAFDWNSYR